MIDFNMIPNAIKAKIIKAETKGQLLTDWLNKLENNDINKLTSHDQARLDDFFAMVITK